MNDQGKKDFIFSAVESIYKKQPFSKFLFDEIPDFLYKFQTFDEGGLHLSSLLKKEAFFSKPTAFDDSTDSFIPIDYSQVERDMEMNPVGFVVHRFAEVATDYFYQLSRFSDNKSEVSKQIFYALSVKDVLALSKIIEHLNIDGKCAEELIDKCAEEIQNKEYIEITKKIISELQEMSLSSEYRNTIDVLCLSELGPDSDMWGEDYGAKGSGFCLKYKKPEYSTDSIWVSSIFPVCYGSRSAVSFLDLLSTDLLNKSEGDDYISFPNLLFTYISLLTKDLEWHRQVEWRFVRKGNRSQPGVALSFPYLTEVISGPTVSKENLALLESDCQKIGVPFIRGRL